MSTDSFLPDNDDCSELACVSNSTTQIEAGLIGDDSHLLHTLDHRDPSAAALESQFDAVVLMPGEPSCLEHQLSLHDPLSGLCGYRFEPFLLPSNCDLLVDLDGDGVPDVTLWGTPVHPVQPYLRSDGTWVDGYYRTNPDGETWNNISTHR